MRDRVTTMFLIALLAVMTCVPLLHTWYTTADDILIVLGLQEGVKMVGLGTAIYTGRLQHIFTGSIAPYVYFWGSYWPMKVMSLVAILATLAAMVYALRILCGSARLAALALVFFFAFAQNTHDHNLLTAFPVISTTGLTVFWLAVATWWLALQGRPRMAVASVALFVCSLLVYENFLVYACIFPLLTAVARPAPWRERLRSAVSTPHVAATVVMVAVMVAFRVLFQQEGGRQMMAVEEYTINLDVVRILKTMERYALSAFPLHYASVYKGLITDFYMGWGTFRVTAQDLFAVVDMGWLAKALIAGYLTLMLTLRREPFVQRRGVLLCIAVVLIALTNLPLAVTAKYQSWAIDNYQHGYLTSYFVLFGVVILIAVVFEGAVSWVSRRSLRLGHAVAGLLAALVFAVCYATDVVNAHVTHTERQMYDKWRTVDQWIASPAFQEMPEGSLILAPTLFDHYSGTLTVFDDYWTRYASVQGKKRVELFRERDAWLARAAESSSDERLFFLELRQERRGDASYLVFSRARGALQGAPISSDEVMVLAHARTDRYRIVGRLLGAQAECRARIFVDGVPTNSTFTDRFGAHIDRVRNAREWLWVRLTSTGAAILPDSVLVTDADVAVDDGVEVGYGKGFQYDEIGYRWAGRSAVLTLRNRTDRALRIELQFAAEAPGLPRGASGRLEAVAGSVRAEWTVGPEYRQYTMPLEIPAASSIDVVFGTDAPQIAAPHDARELVLRFQAGLRAQEIGCQRTT
jgi:hypothetical protein